ncbi:MAG: hypothetical protein GY944_23530 [bacterium]|nr:hypothetical protein [bacterium]
MSSAATQSLASEPSAAEHAARYESLRAYVAKRHAPAVRDGLVVLLRQGLVAWMDTWSRLPAPPSRSARVERPRFSPLADDVSAEVVRVLAAMTLGHLREMDA